MRFIPLVQVVKTGDPRMLTLDVMGPLTLPVDLPVPPFGIVTRNQKARIRKQMRHGNINQLPNGSFDKTFIILESLEYC